jgi:hypothetical protein
MKFPIDQSNGIGYPFPCFRAYQLEEWLDQSKPPVIEMTDKQYATLCMMQGTCVQSYAGIPIQFVEGPHDPRGVLS